MPVLGAFTLGVRPQSQHGSFFYRAFLPFRELERNTTWQVAWTARVEAASDGHFVVRTNDGTLHHPDVMWMQMFRVADAKDKVLRARATGQKVVIDVDDDFTRIPKPNVSGRDLLPGTSEAYFESIGAYDLALCSTAPLERVIRRSGVRTTIIRNAVDPTLYPVHDPADGLVAWVGSTPWRAHDLEILAAAGLGQWLERTGQDFYHAGAVDVPDMATDPRFEVARALGYDWDRSKGMIPPPAHVLARLDPTRVFTSPIQPIAGGRYHELWRRVGVSLIPLEHCPFNDSKSWLKALESCAAGVPYVVSAGFPEQSLLTDEGARGLIARNDKPREWVRALDLLLDPGYRRELGTLNRAVALTHDIAHRWVEWRDALDGLLDPRKSSCPQPSPQVA